MLEAIDNQITWLECHDVGYRQSDYMVRKSCFKQQKIRLHG